MRSKRYIAALLSISILFSLTGYTYADEMFYEDSLLELEEQVNKDIESINYDTFIIKLKNNDETQDTIKQFCKESLEKAVVCPPSKNGHRKA